MPRRTRRGTRFTRRGVRKGSRKTRIRIEQPPDRPFKLLGSTVRGDALRERDQSWWVLHRRGVYRPWAGEDPLEVRAVSENRVRGYLHERILYKKFISVRLYPGSDFDFQCLSMNSRILMSDLKWAELRNISVGDKIVAFDDDTRTYCEAEITHHSSSVVDGLEIELSDGTIMLTTREHPWLVYKDLRYTDRLVKGDSVGWARSDELRPGIKVPKYMDTWEQIDNAEMGWLAGFFDGEGSVIQTTQSDHDGMYLSLTASQNPGLISDYYDELLNRYGFDYSKYEYDYHGGRHDFRISGGVSGSLRFLGLVRPLKMHKLDINELGQIRRMQAVEVVAIRHAKDIEICRLSTSSKTYFAEGFGMHNSSMQGGRMELGGLIVDFIFPHMRLAVRVQGPGHEEYLRGKKDEEQAQILEEMGYRVLDITIREIENERVLDDWVRQYFFGGQFVAAGPGSLAGEFASEREYMQELRGRGGAVLVKLEKIESILEAI